MQQTRHFYHLTMLAALFAVICIPTAGKTIDVFGTPYSLAIIYFPIVYIVSDLLTEVYGYALARRALWYSIIAQLVTALSFGLAAIATPAVSMTNNEAFRIVLAQTPLFVAVGTAATFIGDIVNNYVLARMKVWSGGERMALRFVASTIAGEFVNTCIFYFFALVLTGIIPVEAALISVFGATIFKTLVEVLLLPVSIPLARRLKRIEGVDTFDRDTDFNPLKF